ncbi:energy transducer TonB [Janthinobacterium sp. 17J80-10]|uniref:energy transducer TonB n=1 Tax=Janthinobacterium sp. 17J80-10 TaxID=2497863 RepID=UPI0010059E21|nr:energy transducer TonB [Janthinobacterium sp. 17J80-10]QAU35717.1 energy transducer TonB [Janthinobacterium sp. 17J80-10]
MNFSQNDERSAAKKLGGIGLVIAFHILIAYALLTGLARKVVDVLKEPVDVHYIEEVKPTPPPPPPPERQVQPPPPKTAAPPPPFVPPPEVQVAQPQQQNAIAAVSNAKPDNPVMPSPRTETAPPGPAVVAAVVDFNSCAKPEYPAKSQRNEEQGTVVLQFLIGVDGQVADSKVEKSSGSRDLDKAARSALSLCKFKPGLVDGKPQPSWTKVQYVWKLE